MWPQFLAHYLEPRADVQLRCHQLEALIATGPDPQLHAPALAIWRTGAELPAACAPVFDWLKSQGVLTADEIAARTRLALEAGKLAVARMLIRQLPEARRAPFELWAGVLEDPRRNIERAAASGVEPRGLRDAFAKLARADESVAASVLTRIETQCGVPCTLASPATVAELRSEIGLNQSWSRLPETVSTFRRVPASALDERGHEWRVRAALWGGEWRLALDWIEQMPPSLATQPRWRYWRARCAEKLGFAEQAAAGYEPLTQESGYYAVLAAERLDRGYAPRVIARPSDPLLRQNLATQPGFERAREAYLIDQAAWARSEWNEATAGFDAARLLEAARLASSWGWHLQAVATSTRAEVFDDYDLLYPRPYEADVASAARRARLPPQWIYGVLRQESLYDPKARSSADALGLLQLLPETARAVARRGGLPAPSRADLFDPPTNLILGAGYLREQHDNFGGRFVLVLGAYNAGPGAVRRWLPQEAIETDVWIENVPFNETRNYIQRIVWHSTVFGWKASGKPQRITPWLTPISSDLAPLPTAAGG
jgi:soluble lytic murein transglycosylase